ncbi:MAG: COR domain-containing protein, partial [Lewinella sp.]
HQFFLTPNAVYVLMLGARGEAPNLAYWFKIISLLGKDKSGGKVSLIIVLNKKKGSTGMPQYQDLLKIYAEDFDYQFIEVDLAVNDKRWESLRESIEQRLVNLPIVKNELPKKWSAIRESLREAAQEKPYIDCGRLHSLCKPFEVTEEADQFLMTEYLHQLGSVLHFQGEEDNLMDLIVLSPEWVVEGVYTVLKNEQIREKLKGKFSARDMTKILCENTYQIGEKEEKYSRVDANKLIQLMSKNNFDICYRSESGKYVAAQLLPDDRPTHYQWSKNYNAALQFRYQYPIMPKGLMSRLIVQLSDDLEIIEGQEIVWKKGAILRMEFDGSVCRVLMREEDGETKTGLRQIVVEVLEDNPPYRNRKYALQRVRQKIESLHRRWFKNITSEQIIPCNCEECKESDAPFTFELTQLMRLKKGHAYCNVLEDVVPLQQLLEGVYEPKEIQSFVRDQTARRQR